MLSATSEFVSGKHRLKNLPSYGRGGKRLGTLVPVQQKRGTSFFHGRANLDIRAHGAFLAGTGPWDNWRLYIRPAPEGLMSACFESL